MLFSFESISAVSAIFSISVAGDSEEGGSEGSLKSTMCDGDGVRLGAEEGHKESKW